MAQNPLEWDDEWRVQERETELEEWRKRLPLIIPAVEDRHLFLERVGMFGKARELETLLEWLRSPDRLVS